MSLYFNPCMRAAYLLRMSPGPCRPSGVRRERWGQRFPVQSITKSVKPQGWKNCRLNNSVLYQKTIYDIYILAFGERKSTGFGTRN